MKVFRQSCGAATSELVEYIRMMAFDPPSYDAALGSFIYVQNDGCIRSALLAIPMQFVAHGRILPARLLCAYMTDGQNEAAGAAALTLTIRAKHQDLAFSDSASPKSRAHMKAVGGVVLSLQNLEWTRTLQPLGAFVGHIEQRMSRRRRPGLSALTRPIDAMIRAVSVRIAPPAAQGMRVSEMALESFLDEAPGLIAHYAIRPLWARDELAWFVGLASQSAESGPFRMRAVHDQSGSVIGCFVYYGERGRPARVLNVLARQGKEVGVVTAMIHDLDQAGSTEVVGRTQPALMEGLAAQRMLSFRHKAFACLTTRHADIASSAERGDIYIGGLAGESWSRLMSDFW